MPGREQPQFSGLGFEWSSFQCCSDHVCSEAAVSRSRDAVRNPDTLAGGRTACLSETPATEEATVRKRDVGLYDVNIVSSDPCESSSRSLKKWVNPLGNLGHGLLLHHLLFPLPPTPCCTSHSTQPQIAWECMKSGTNATKAKKKRGTRGVSCFHQPDWNWQKRNVP